MGIGLVYTYSRADNHDDVIHSGKHWKAQNLRPIIVLSALLYQKTLIPENIVELNSLKMSTWNGINMSGVDIHHYNSYFYNKSINRTICGVKYDTLLVYLSSALDT